MCKLYSPRAGSGWAVTICLGMWVAKLQCPGHKDFASSVMLASRAMRTIWCLNVRACSTFEIDAAGLFERGYTIGECSSSCGRQTCMGLQFKL